MNKDIIRMARECGLHLGGPPLESGLARFAALVRADEREACARVCEQMPDLEHGWRATLPSDCAAAIRARSKE